MNPRTVQGLLDPAEASRLLAVLDPAAPARPIALDTVWAKPDRHFNVSYRLGNGGAGCVVSLCVVDDSARAARGLARHGESAGRLAAMVADDVLAQRFPFDYRLGRLAECLQPSLVHPILGDDLVDGCEVAAYRPGMRCQLRFTSRGVARAYGKTAVERDPGRRRRMHRDVHAATATTALRVPPLLGTVDGLGLDIVAAAAGRSLHDELTVAADATLVARTATALAQLHACVPAPEDRVHTVADELALVVSWTRWISEVEPSLDARLADMLASIATAAPATDPATFVHRDFYDKQVLFDGPRMWMLDVDTACTGDRELDLGNFLSHLFLRGVQWDRVAEHRRLESAAQDAYGTARPAVTRWYRRASLLRLACMYFLRPHWRHVVPALLEEAGTP